MAAETRVYVLVAVILGCSCFLWLCTEGILDCPPQCGISGILVCILGRRGVVSVLLYLQHPTAVAVAEERRCVGCESATSVLGDAWGSIASRWLLARQMHGLTPCGTDASMLCGVCEPCCGHNGLSFARLGATHSG